MALHLGAMGRCGVGWRAAGDGAVASGQQAGSSTDLKEAHRVLPSWGIRKEEAGQGPQLGQHLGSWQMEMD